MGTIQDLEGRLIKFKGKNYQLNKETVKGGCKGCVFEDKNVNGCPDSLTDYCREGFILKKINK